MNLDVVRLVDLVIALTGIEFLALALYRRHTRRGIPMPDFAINMASGLCLMAALRCLAADSGLRWVALWLAAAGIAHVTDIAARLRKPSAVKAVDWERVQP